MKSYFLFLLIIILLACKPKGDSPSILLDEVIYVSVHVAAASGNITFPGSSEIKQYGICYNTKGNPTIDDKHSVNPTWLGMFSDTLVNLTPATNYKIRAYAINNEGITYSNELSFITGGGLPTIINPRIEKNQPPNAVVRARIQPNKVVTNAYFEYGLTNEYELGIVGLTNNINSSSEITAGLNGLIPNQEYHFRVVTENEVGKVMSEDISFISNFTIGDEYNDGLIAYVDNTGLHGFISRSTYVSGSQGIGYIFEWGPWPRQFHNATGCAINDGESNTTQIMTDNGNDVNFVSIIYNMKKGSNEDWFMPSKDELNIVRQNIYLKGYGSFIGGSYWSSSEISQDSVWAQNFATGVQFKALKNGYVSVGISYF